MRVIYNKYIYQKYIRVKLPILIEVFSLFHLFYLFICLFKDKYIFKFYKLQSLQRVGYSNIYADIMKTKYKNLLTNLTTIKTNL